jgi:hypothetical protein
MTLSLLPLGEGEVGLTSAGMRVLGLQLALDILQNTML